MKTFIKSLDEYYSSYITEINYIDYSYYNGTSLLNPLVYIDGNSYKGNQIYINSTYYKLHKKKIDNLIIDTIKSTTKADICISSSWAVSTEMLNAITTNPNIKQVEFTWAKTLSENLLDNLLQGNLNHITCSVDLESNPDLIYEYIPGLTIQNYPSVAGATVMDFGMDNVKLHIKERLSKKQLEQLKKLFDKYPQEKILLKVDYDGQIEELKNIMKTEKTIIVMDYNEKYRLEDYEYFNDRFSNLLFEGGYKSYFDVKWLIKQEEIFKAIIEEVNSYDFFPLEKYMYLYNIVKMFKEYKEAEKFIDRTKARNSIYTLFNDYMVCVGYAVLLTDLVKRLDDPNLTVANYSCKVCDNGEKIGHSKCLVKLYDEKYGIDGVYISDPTWDSVTYYRRFKDEDGNTQIDYSTPLATVDRYNHFLMTKEEVLDEDIEYCSPDVTDILFSEASTYSQEEITSTICYKAEEIIKELNPKKVFTSKKIVREIANIKQSPINSEIITSAIRYLYGKIYYSDSKTIEELVNNTIYNNNLIQTQHFGVTKDKFDNPKIKKYSI